MNPVNAIGTFSRLDLFEKKAMIAKGINLNQQLCLEDVFIEWER